VRRSACRERYERGELAPAAASARLQFLRLAGAALGHRLRSATRRLVRFVYGLWASLLFWLLAPPFWLLCVLMPTPAAAWRVARFGARALLRGTSVPLKVCGLEQLPDRPAVLVCNHASYIDGLVLVAALPRPCSFVAKHELAGQWIAGSFLRRLGTLFVERVDRRRSVEDAQQLAVAAARGQSLLVFPEGSFKPEPGLLPFHLGAFAAAVDAGVPVVPLALHGTRELLPYPSWFPRPAVLAVKIGNPLSLATRGDGFAAAVGLRDAARAWIVRAQAGAQDGQQT
jgi:1-acyl-sn-glycerol-3-phosphate acyltransferase